MDAAPIARPLPDLRLRLLKAAVVIPDLLTSGLITFVLLAALPPENALGFIAGMLAMSIGVASGRGEGLAVRILHAARRPTARMRDGSRERCSSSSIGAASRTSAS